MVDDLVTRVSFPLTGEKPWKESGYLGCQKTEVANLSYSRLAVSEDFFRICFKFTPAYSFPGRAGNRIHLLETVNNPERLFQASGCMQVRKLSHTKD